MVSYSGGFPQYYTTPHAHAIHALHAQQAAAQYAMYQQQQLTQQYQFYPEVCHTQAFTPQVYVFKLLNNTYKRWSN